MRRIFEHKKKTQFEITAADSQGLRKKSGVRIFAASSGRGTRSFRDMPQHMKEKGK